MDEYLSRYAGNPLYLSPKRKGKRTWKLMFSCTCQHFTADITLYIVIKAFITPNFSNGWILENVRKW